MPKNKKFKDLQKEIKQTCPVCQTIYQLLEIHIKSLPTNQEQCLNNCLAKWKEILHEHYNKEIVNYLNEQENEKGDDE